MVQQKSYQPTAQFMWINSDIKVTVKQNAKAVAEVVTDANGSFTFNAKVATAGLATFQVVFPASVKNSAGASDEITVLVR